MNSQKLRLLNETLLKFLSNHQLNLKAQSLVKQAQANAKSRNRPVKALQASLILTKVWSWINEQWFAQDAICEQ